MKRDFASVVTGMPVLREKPPIYDEASKLFNLKQGDTTFFTFGPCIYNPDGVNMPNDLRVHEEVHGHQQEHDEVVAKLWWKRYMEDPKFRYEQELEAYGVQYQYLASRIRDRNQLARALHTISGMLSSPMYGSLVTQGEAAKALRAYVQK